MAEVTCPALITASTADVLVPAEQFGAPAIRAFDAGLMPAGFVMDMDAIVTRHSARLRLLAVLPPEEVELFTVRPPEEAGRLRFDLTIEGGKMVPLPIPFSRDRRISMVVIDEGSPEPQCAHTKFGITSDAREFLDFQRSCPLRQEQLTAAKLHRLMQRCLHVEAHPQLIRHPDEPARFVANRLDFPAAERQDVLRGLLTYARDPACAARLRVLYGALPKRLKALGAELADGGPAQMIERLRDLDGGP